MSFSDIKGQDSSLEILQGHMKNARLARGYLFLGPEGVGKVLTAKTLAKALNCKENNLDSCDKCPSCLKIESNQHPDVHIVDSEDAEIKIEDIRNLQSQISLRPYEGRFKVFIIKNAHSLNQASGNAFLKTLEESPGESVIILLSDKPNLLLKTIISRCQAIKFYPVPRLN
ncbi:MAG: AAA family ATPase [Candidatus Omnitrophota bacterium]